MSAILHLTTPSKVLRELFRYDKIPLYRNPNARLTLLHTLVRNCSKNLTSSNNDRRINHKPNFGRKDARRSRASRRLLPNVRRVPPSWSDPVGCQRGAEGRATAKLRDLTVNYFAKNLRKRPLSLIQGNRQSVAQVTVAMQQSLGSPPVGIF